MRDIALFRKFLSVAVVSMCFICTSAWAEEKSVALSNHLNITKAPDISGCPDNWTLRGNWQKFTPETRQVPNDAFQLERDRILLDESHHGLMSLTPFYFFGAGRQSVLRSNLSGYAYIEGDRISNVGMVELNNRQKNVILVLAPGLSSIAAGDFVMAPGYNPIPNSDLFVLADAEMDVLYLDGCLKWEGPLQSKLRIGSVRYIAYDTEGFSHAVEVTEGTAVQFLSPDKIQRWANFRPNASDITSTITDVSTAATRTNQNKEEKIFPTGDNLKGKFREFSPTIPQKARDAIHRAVADNSSAKHPRVPTRKFPAKEFLIAKWGFSSLDRMGVIQHPAWEEIPENILEQKHNLLELYPPCLLRGDYTVWCWFRKKDQTQIEAKMLDMPPILSLEAGKNNYKCARSVSNEVWCLRGNFEVRKYVPKWLLAEPDNKDFQKLWKVFSEVRIGGDESCGLTIKGQIWCWGKSYTKGKYYHGRDEIVEYPLEISLPLPAKKLHQSGVCALLSDNSQWCWEEDVNTKAWQFMPGESFSSIGSCSLRKNDGSIWCTNDKSKERSQGSPVEVSEGELLEGIVQINTYGTCGIDKAGIVWCWKHYRGNPNALDLGFASKVLAPGANAPLTGALAFAKGHDRMVIVRNHPTKPNPSIQWLTSIEMGDFESAAHLRQLNQKITAKGNYAERALVSAARNQRIDIVKELLEADFAPGDKKAIREYFRKLNYEQNEHYSWPNPNTDILSLMFNADLWPGVDIIERTALLEKISSSVKGQEGGKHLMSVIDKKIQSGIKSKSAPLRVLKECPEFTGSVKDLVEKVPVIAIAKYSNRKGFLIDKVYKGPRKKNITVALNQMAEVPEIDRSMLLLSYPDSNTPCTISFYLDEPLIAETAAEILAEVSLYDAELTNSLNVESSTTSSRSKRDFSDWNVPLDKDFPHIKRYVAASEIVKKYGDFLLLMELVSDEIEDLVVNHIKESDLTRIFNSDDIDAYARLREEFPPQCLEDFTKIYSYLPSGTAEKLQRQHMLEAMLERSSSFNVALGYLMGDLALALTHVGDDFAALASLCYSHQPELYMELMSSLGLSRQISTAGLRRLKSLKNADLRDLKFPKVEIVNAVWDGVDLTNAQLREARFIGADLRKVILNNTDFTGAEYDCLTQFPVNFSPENNGMKVISNRKCEEFMRLSPLHKGLIMDAPR